MGGDDGGHDHKHDGLGHDHGDHDDASYGLRQTFGALFRCPSSIGWAPDPEKCNVITLQISCGPVQP